VFQWIADVFSSIVTTKHQFGRSDGILHHKNLAQVGVGVVIVVGVGGIVIVAIGASVGGEIMEVTLM